MALRRVPGARIWWVALACLLVAAAGLSAEEPDTLLPMGIHSLQEFQRVPVLFNGRQMPMDSFARNMLLQFSGRRTLGEASAAEWMAQVLFEPGRSSGHRIFLINHPDVVRALGIEPRKRRRYAFDELHPAVLKLQGLAQKSARLDEDRRSPVETELIRTYVNLTQFIELTKSLRFAIPHPAFSVSDPELRDLLQLDPPQEDLRFLDIYRRGSMLQPILLSAQDKPQEEWTTPEQEAFRLSSSLFAWSRAHGGLFLTLLPADPHGEETWLSPWDLLNLNPRDPGLRNALDSLADMVAAYRAGGQAEFDMATRSYRVFVESRMKDDRARTHLGTEVLFHRLRLFYLAAWLYGIAFLAACLSFLGGSRFFGRIAWGATVLGLGLHASGILMRMGIMGRPPVTNLYATFLFVAMICVICGLVVEAIQRNGLGLLVSGIGGLVLLLVAGRFFDDGDTMGKVVAVLDSNFWLSTHVLAITTGYAGCVFAGVIGHIYLLCAVLAPRDRERLASIYRALVGALAFGLIFSFLGTMLGGVWADQSWGRFWGWDPKENGALLIVLWCAVLFHARIGGMIGSIGLAGGSVLGVIFVLLAWLGVNLLSVGLHSYGFTSGLATGLIAAVAVEVGFVAVMVPVARARSGGPADRPRLAASP